MGVWQLPQATTAFIRYAPRAISASSAARASAAAVSAISAAAISRRHMAVSFTRGMRHCGMRADFFKMTDARA
jgi:hypothetical protein